MSGGRESQRTFRVCVRSRQARRWTSIGRQERPRGHPEPARDSRGALTVVASRLRKPSFVLRPAGGAGNEVLRSCDENVEFGPLQRAQRRCEAGIGEPLAQQSNGGLVLGIGVPRRRSLQAGIDK
jgi:hypothetical protein